MLFHDTFLIETTNECINPCGLVRVWFRSVPIGSMVRFRVFQPEQTVVWLIPLHTIAQSRDLVTDRSVVAYTVKFVVRIKIQGGLPPWFVLRLLFSPETLFKSEFTFCLNSWMRAALRLRRDYARWNSLRDRVAERVRGQSDVGSSTTKVQQVRISGHIPESARSGSQATQKVTMAYLQRGCFTIGTGSMSSKRKRGSNGDKIKSKKERPKKGRKKRKKKEEG